MQLCTVIITVCLIEIIYLKNETQNTNEQLYINQNHNNDKKDKQRDHSEIPSDLFSSASSFHEN